MKHDITTLDLILYLFNEVTYMKKLAIEHALSSNPDLRAELDELRLANMPFDECESLIEPPAAVVQNILNYSRTTTETCR